MTDFNVNIKHHGESHTVFVLKSVRSLTGRQVFPDVLSKLFGTRAKKQPTCQAAETHVCRWNEEKRAVTPNRNMIEVCFFCLLHLVWSSSINKNYSWDYFVKASSVRLCVFTKCWFLTEGKLAGQRGLLQQHLPAAAAAASPQRRGH